MTTVGAIALPYQPLERYLQIARAADEVGLDELWLWEDCFAASGIGAAAALLGATERLRIGVGVLPVPLRNVAVTAMEIATLERLFPGRLVVGLGHGVQDWMGQVGARPRSMLTLFREHALALRALLDGEEVTVDGEYVHLDHVRLEWPPERRVPFYAGVTGPRSLRLAGEVADGAVLSGGTSPAGVERARGLLVEGAPAGRTEAPRIIQYLPMATGTDAEERMARDRSHWNDMSEEETTTVGDGAAVAATIGRFAGAGADTVVLQPTLDEPDPVAFVRFVATEVAPLVRAG